MENPISFSDSERAGLYKTIFNRRDVRGEFLPDAIPDDVLARVLTAAHFAPSVGFMQPWSFIVITDTTVKQQIHDDFTSANAEAAAMFEGDQQTIYRTLKLEGILEAPINLCVTCDRERAGPVVIGRTHIRTMDLYSSVCAVQNLWLAARAEGLGVGWVSILHPHRLQDILGIPKQVVPVAYLCLGRVSHFHARPELEAAGWRPRLPLEQLIHGDRWGGTAPEPLLEAARASMATVQKGDLAAPTAGN